MYKNYPLEKSARTFIPHYATYLKVQLHSNLEKIVTHQKAIAPTGNIRISYRYLSTKLWKGILIG